MSLVSAVDNTLTEKTKSKTSTTTATTTISRSSKPPLPSKTATIIEEFDYIDDETIPRTMLPPYKHYREIGDPLSKEAIYKAKLKYKYYSTPNTQYTVGFPNADDAAGRAAIYAKLLTHVKPVEPFIIHQDAISAAKSLTSYTTETRNMENRNETTQSKLDREKKVLRDKLYSLNSATKVYSDSLKAVKSVEPPRSTYQPMNLSKVLSGAEKRASTRINTRYTPESNKIIQLRTQNALNAAHAVNANDYLPERLAEERAHKAELEKQKLEIYEYMTSPKVWEIATHRAGLRLETTDIEDTEQLLFGNMDYNRKAVQYAQKKLQHNVQKESELAERTQGKINLGGGLWLANRDVDDIARSYVKPMLKRVDVKADEERKMDMELDRRTYKYENDYEQWKQLQYIRNNNDFELANEIQAKNEAEKREIEVSTQKDIEDYIVYMEQKLAQKRQELSDIEMKKKNLQIQLANKRANLETAQNSQLSDWMKVNERDIDQLQREEAGLTKPYYNILQESEDIQDKLQDQIKAMHVEIKDLKNELQVHDKNILELNDRLEMERAPISLDKESIQETEFQTEKKSIISLGHKEKENAKKKHEMLLVTLDKQKHEQENLATSKRKKLENLERVISIHEKELEINREELAIRKEKVDLLKAVDTHYKDVNADKLSPAVQVNDIVSEFGDSDVIRIQNEAAKEDDANVIKDDEYQEDENENEAENEASASVVIPEGSSEKRGTGTDGYDEDENTIGKIHTAERAKNRGKPTMVITSSSATPVISSNVHFNDSGTSFGSYSINGAEASASARSVTGVSGVMSEFPIVDENSPKNIVRNNVLKDNIINGTTTKGDKSKIKKPYVTTYGPTAVTAREPDSPLKHMVNEEGKSNESFPNSGKDTIPSFSGFSQGSIKDQENNRSPSVELNSFNEDYDDDEEDQRELNRKDSFFKEVF